MTTAEKNAPLASEMLDVWMSTTKTLNWSQDQMQTLTHSWMEQTKTMRHDGEKVLEVMVSQAKSNVEEMSRNMQSALNAVPAWDALTMGDMRRQMNELAKRMDELSSK